jgi:hypothetical protein
MGCMNKVFRGEIDQELFEQAERTRHGFGGVKMTGLPLPQCRASVERAYDGYTEAFECVNPGFFTKPSSRISTAHSIFATSFKARRSRPTRRSRTAACDEQAGTAIAPMLPSASPAGRRAGRSAWLRAASLAARSAQPATEQYGSASGDAEPNREEHMQHDPIPVPG